MKPCSACRVWCGCALIFTASFPTQAAVFNIANGDVAALKAAINTANLNNEADTIILATNGSYVLTTVDNTDHGPSGLPVLVYDNDHALVIAGNGSIITRDAAAPAFRILTIYNQLGNLAFDVSLDQVTISNGNAQGQGEGGYGGGIFNSGSLLILTNCTISGDHAFLGRWHF